MNEYRQQTGSTIHYLHGGDEEEIRRLITEAGPRPEVPPEDLAGVRSAARAEWRRLVEAERERRRSRRRLIPVALAAVLLVVLGAVFWRLQIGGPGGSEPVAWVELLKGEVSLEGPDGEVRPQSGGALVAGTVLVTGHAAREAPTLAALRLDAGQSLRIDGETRVRLLSTSSIELERGAVYVDSGPGPAPAGAITIQTPFGTVTEIGTQFEVRLTRQAGEALRVRVREGSVSLDLRTATHPATAGEELTLGPDGSIRRRSIEPWDRSWDWVLAAAPTLEIEGLALTVYLEWVARETGRRVRFADRDLAAEAVEIRLHGSIDGLTPDESLEVVLPGSGLGHRIETGLLTITRPPAGPG